MSTTKLGRRDSEQTSRTCIRTRPWRQGVTQRGEKNKKNETTSVSPPNLVWQDKNFIPDCGRKMVRPLSNEPIPLHPSIWSISGMKQHWHVSRDRTLILLDHPLAAIPPNGLNIPLISYLFYFFVYVSKRAREISSQHKENVKINRYQ